MIGLCAACLLAQTSASPISVPAQEVLPPPDEACLGLPPVHPPFAFSPGETLEYDLDALGAKAGKLKVRVGPAREGLIPIEVVAQTNTFFSKVRKVTGGATTYLSASTLRPSRYIEDTREDDLHKTAHVAFDEASRKIDVQFTYGTDQGTAEYHYAHDGLEPLGAIFLLRQIPWRAGSDVCFDAYGIRRLWRVFGTIVGKERIPSAFGEVEAWHLSGTAVRMDYFKHHRAIHLWITDDLRRLPIAAVGVIDLGAVRATLTSYRRPGEKRIRAEGKEKLTW